MFRRKKDALAANIYDDEWNRLQDEKIDAWRTIDELFSKIQYSISAMSCFEDGTVDYDAEAKHLQELRKKMLCACGTYDGCQTDLRMLYDAHHEEMQEQFCLNGLSRPEGNCHEVLRRCARAFKKYR